MILIDRIHALAGEGRYLTKEQCFGYDPILTTLYSGVNFATAMAALVIALSLLVFAARRTPHSKNSRVLFGIVFLAIALDYFSTLYVIFIPAWYVDLMISGALATAIVTVTLLTIRQVIGEPAPKE